MTVKRVSAYAITLGNPGRAVPVHEGLLDFFALGVGADPALVLMSPLADGGSRRRFPAVQLSLRATASSISRKLHVWHS